MKIIGFLFSRKLQFIQNAYTTNTFIRAILTTTPSYSHVSNFRDQPRTDSRADKPDIFPGFDLTDETTPSPHKRRRQAYSLLLRMFIEKTRERLETIRDVVKDEPGLHFQLIRPGDDDGDDVSPTSARLRASAAVAEGSDSMELIDFDSEDIDDLNESNDSIRPNLPAAYFSSLLTAIGFKRVPKQPMENEKQTSSDNNGNVITTYLLNPLLNIWHQAREKLNFNSNYRSVDSGKNNGNENAIGKSTLNSFEIVEERKLNINAENTENNTNTTRALDEETVVILESSIVTTIEPSLSSLSTDDDGSTSLPFKLSANKRSFNTASIGSGINNDGTQNTGNLNGNNGNNRTESIDSSDSDDITILNEIVLNADSNVQRAATAFQNAFFNYANYNGGNNGNKTSDASATNSTFAELNSLPNGLLDGFLNDQMSNIQVIPLDKYNHSMHSASDDRHSSSAQTAGIFVLEMFGTVIGLAWGAFSQVQNWLGNSTRVLG